MRLTKIDVQRESIHTLHYLLMSQIHNLGPVKSLLLSYTYVPSSSLAPVTIRSPAS